MMGNKRSRGAQPGNANALKHGFYSSIFQGKEIDDLDARMQAGVNDEVAMLRVFTRRLAEIANGVSDLNGMIDALGALGLSSVRLASILRVQRILGGDQSEVMEAISGAIDEVMKEWNR